MNFRWFRRKLPTWQHEWEALTLRGQIVDQFGNLIGCSERRTRVCVHCLHTEIFAYMPCTRDRDRDPEGDETRSGSVERSEIEPGPSEETASPESSRND